MPASSIRRGTTRLMLLASIALLFASIKPTHAQYTSFQKISDTQGGFNGTLDDRDEFGWSMTSIGDLDGDGTSDLAVGSSGDDDGGIGHGAVWILFLNTDGTVKAHQKISDTEGGFTGTLDDNDRLGSSVAALGDLNNDGIPDLAVGARFDDDGGSALNNAEYGAVYILFLNTDGTVNDHQKISNTQGGLTQFTLSQDDYFGSSVTSLGDFNGDGTPDLAVGAPGDDDGDDDRGAVWILFLNTDGTVNAEQKISSTDGEFTGTLDENDSFGYSVATLGDFNGDSIPELAVGAPQDDDGGDDSNRGAVWILFLNADGTVKGHKKISGDEGAFFGTLDGGDLFGASAAALGDLDGDGLSELAVGASADDDGGSSRGAVWILFLNPEGTVNRYEKVSDTEGGFSGTLDDNDRFGGSITSLGDFDGNGLLDLVAGAYDDGDGGFSRGAVWLLFRQYPALTAASVLPAEAIIGETLTMDIVLGSPITPTFDLFGISFRITYDPNVLHVNKLLPGSFIDDGDLLTFTDVDNVNGEASGTFSRQRGAPGVNGHGSIAEVTFNVVGAGTTLYTFTERLASRVNGSTFIPETGDGTIDLFSLRVWPGDTDNSGTVNIDDLLPIGSNFDAAGPARDDQSLTWSPKLVPLAWNPVDLGHADATGDGQVDHKDVLPIGLNMGLTQTLAPQEAPATGIASAKTVADIPYRLRVYHNRRKQQARARLVLGSSANPATDLLGTAITLSYDPAVYRFRSHQPGHLIDDGDLLSLDDKQDGTLSVAYTRKAPNGSVTGRGPVLDVLFDVIGEPHSEAMSLQTLTLGSTHGSVAVVGPDAVAARAERGLDTLPAEPVVAKAEEETPVTFALTGAYPNPFNPATTIAFDLPERAEVSLIVVDLLGREVRRIDAGTLAAGAGQTVRFAADGLPSGVYLYRIEARTSEALRTATGRFTLVK